jgi:hypothetical protein
MKQLLLPKRYLPKGLTKGDKQKQLKMLMKSRRLYKKGKYYTRKNVSSFKSKKSHYVDEAKKMYKVNKIGATSELSNSTRCKKSSLAKIIKKGEGAYYSSGSRPNQTAQSWGIARLASAITSGKASVVDYAILEKGCTSSSRALRLAKKALTKKNKEKTRKVPKIKI